MSSSKLMKTILKWVLIICLIFLIIISISNMTSSQDNKSQSEYDFNISHDDGDVNDGSYDIDYEDDSNIESDENYNGVDDSPMQLQKTTQIGTMTTMIMGTMMTLMNTWNHKDNKN